MRTGVSTGRDARGRRAFTLVELMTVLVLIAIMTALIIPEMKGTFEDALLRSTGRQIVDVIELSSSRAISLNQTVRVELDTATGRYQMERKTHHGTVENFEPLNDSGTTGKLDTRIAVQIVPQDEEGLSADSEGAQQLTNQVPSLTFNPDGTADGAMILLKDRAGFRLLLRLNPITSRVNIVEAPQE